EERGRLRCGSRQAEGEHGVAREDLMARPKARTSARRTPRRTATNRAPARKQRNGARMRAKARPPQRFVVSHHREDDFESGLRSYAKYRDLGIVKATNGMVRA